MTFTYTDNNNIEWSFSITEVPKLNNYLKVKINYPLQHKGSLNYTARTETIFIDPNYTNWEEYKTEFGADYYDFINRAIKLFVTFS